MNKLRPVSGGHNFIVRKCKWKGKLRLWPIVRTSLAFNLEVVLLVLANGAGAIARQTIGWTVIGGMLAANFLATFVAPVLYVVITKLAYGSKKLKDLELQCNSINSS